MKPQFSNAFAQARLGGSWDLHHTGLRRFRYDANHPMARLDHMGLRLVRDSVERKCKRG